MKSYQITLLAGLFLYLGCGQEEAQPTNPLLDRFAGQTGMNFLNSSLNGFWFPAFQIGILQKRGLHKFMPKFRKSLDDSTSEGGGTGPDPYWTDTTMYDPSTGFWTYRHDDPWGFYEARYRYEPHDDNGNQTAETDKMEYSMVSESKYGDEFLPDRWISTSESHYEITGLKDWYSDDGEMVYNGSSKYSSTEKFTADTLVSYEFESKDENIRMKQNGCSPYTGKMSFKLKQDATPDRFFRDIYIHMGVYCDTTAGCNADGTYRIEYSDQTMKGQTIFEENGIRYIIDGNEYFYEIDCGTGSVTLAN